jgi:lysyl-tRNA synthetase class 2
MLQAVHGGAAARPFQTHLNALDIDLFPAYRAGAVPQTVRGRGIEKVFEINRNFRNEGIDSSHSPEFAMLEAYQAYGSYDTMALLTRNSSRPRPVRFSPPPPCDSPTARTTNLGGEWASVTMYGSLSAAVGQEIDVTTPREQLVSLAERFDVEVLPHFGPGKLAEELFEALVAPSLYAPTFVRDYPRRPLR